MKNIILTEHVRGKLQAKFRIMSRTGRGFVENGGEVKLNLYKDFGHISKMTGLTEKTLWRIYHDYTYMNIKQSTFSKIDTAYNEFCVEPNKAVRKWLKLDSEEIPVITKTVKIEAPQEYFFDIDSSKGRYVRFDYNTNELEYSDNDDFSSPPVNEKLETLKRTFEEFKEAVRDLASRNTEVKLMDAYDDDIFFNTNDLATVQLKAYETIEVL